MIVDDDGSDYEPDGSADEDGDDDNGPQGDASNESEPESDGEEEIAKNNTRGKGRKGGLVYMERTLPSTHSVGFTIQTVLTLNCF